MDIRADTRGVPPAAEASMQGPSLVRRDGPDLLEAVLIRRSWMRKPPEGTPDASSRRQNPTLSRSNRERTELIDACEGADHALKAPTRVN